MTNSVNSRFDHVKYDDISNSKIELLKHEFEVIDSMLTTLLPGRAKEIAFDRLEEAYMWVGKALRDEQLARTNG